jgi:hypothetical protein
VDTIWADEHQKTRAFMRMSITEVEDDDCGMMAMPTMPEMPCDIEMPKMPEFGGAMKMPKMPEFGGAMKMPAMPDMGAACDTMKSAEQKVQATIKCMMKKANTTLEQAKKAVEKANVCDIDLRG